MTLNRPLQFYLQFEFLGVIMPNYDYKCENCDTITEVFHSITAEPDLKCEKCGSPLKRMISAGAGLIFKGSGYYVTDSKTSCSKSEKSGGSTPCANGNCPKK